MSHRDSATTLAVQPAEPLQTELSVEDANSKMSHTAAVPEPSSKPASTAVKRFIGTQIPDDILNNEHLNTAIKQLPSNYNFEIHKTLWRLRACQSKRVALQFPEGLLMYACTISNILERFGNVETLIMGDITYGACCIDDYTAKSLECDFLVHYGHSCLVPVDVSQMNTLYVFVDISFQISHLISMLIANFAPETRLILAGTIQFSSTLQAARRVLSTHFPNVIVPRCAPLSQAEVLGCTSPQLSDLLGSENGSTNTPATSCCRGSQNECESSSSSSLSCTPGSTSSCCEASSTVSPNECKQDSCACVTQQPSEPVCVFVADGRFHLESLMIHNPQIKRFYKYDPYNKMLTEESYAHATMHAVRSSAVEQARKAKVWGVVYGTLGRQGSATLLKRIENILTSRGLNYVSVLLSEVFPGKLALFRNVEAWVQIACPRLSIDWGDAFNVPLLSTYEFDVAMGLAEWLPKGVYPMDFYSHEGGAWSNYHEIQKQKRELKVLRNPRAAAGLIKKQLPHLMKKNKPTQDMPEATASTSSTGVNTSPAAEMQTKPQNVDDVE